MRRTFVEPTPSQRGHDPGKRSSYFQCSRASVLVALLCATNACSASDEPKSEQERTTDDSSDTTDGDGGMSMTTVMTTGAAGAAGTTGGADSDGLVVLPPAWQDGRLVLGAGPFELEVDPARGARIVRFSYEGHNVLAGPEFHDQYWGSTFWVSPEDAWESSSPSGHDSGRYVVESGETLPVVMETAAPSTKGPGTIHVTKAFDIDPADGAALIAYTVENAGESATQLAPWEVTRLPGGQVSFFPYASTERSTDGIRLSIVDGIAWFDHTEDVDPAGQKVWADGAEGWAAHVSGDVLYVKKFEDLSVAETAEGETDVEIYSSDVSGNSQAYIELEAQGRVVTLAPGEQTTWTVRWYLIPIPEGVDRSVGSVGLVELARGAGR